MTRGSPSQDIPRSSRWMWFGVFVFALNIGTQLFAVLTSPADRDMGDLQKIMYVHVPAAWITFLAFILVAIYSALYLMKGRERDDLISAASAEVGVVFCGLTLILGMLWGKPAWGAWWVWDARLTSTLVLFLIFVGYLALREFVEDQDRRAQWSAAVGLFGAINVPIVYMSVRWWRTLHQIQSNLDTLDPRYRIGLAINAVAMTLIMIYLVRRRYEVSMLRRSTELAAQAAALGGQ